MRFSDVQKEAIGQASGTEGTGPFVLRTARELAEKRKATILECASEDELPVSTWLREVASHAAGISPRYVIKGL
jgi:hypothetical protein